MSNKISPTFCVLPWMHLAANSSGNVRLCCNSTPGKNIVLGEDGRAFNLADTESVTDFWNVEWMKNIRREMLAGKRPEICQRCFREEDAGVKSARQGWNDKYEVSISKFIEQTSPDGEAMPNIQYVDLRLGNLCNLKCLMCNPYASNQWTTDWNEHYPESKINDSELRRLTRLRWFEEEALWKLLDEMLPTIEEIYLTGGEPTLAKKQYYLLQNCIEKSRSKDIILKYNTNIVSIPAKMISYWKHFKKVRLNISIDGFDKVNEVIRYPSDWSVINKNLHMLDELSSTAKNIDLSIHTTVQVYNVFSLVKLFEYLKDFKHIRIFPYLNILDHPAHLNVRVLPKELKNQVSEMYTEWINKNSNTFKSGVEADYFQKLEGMIRYMEMEDWSQHLPRMLTFNSSIEKSRGYSVTEKIPELKGLLK